MVPAKSRERKCSTCKHYQASPLWRKGWCRNPLLYDRNTNHLVEADSLACNRTFIDYWEPADERAAAQGGAARSTTLIGPKPRVAPSIPIETMDATGAPIVSTEKAKAMASSPAPKSRKPMFKPLTEKEQLRPPLSLVDEEYDELEPDPKVTAKIPQMDRQRGAGSQVTARQRIQQARSRRPGAGALPQMSGPGLWIGLGAVGLVILVVAGLLVFGGRNNTPAVATNTTPSPQKSVVAPSPTGVGDVIASPTSASLPTASVGAQVPSEIAVGGYVKVVNTGAGDGLIIRSGPTRQGARVTKMPDGTRMHVIDGPTEAEGYTWWKVDGFNPQSPDMSGWCADDFLAPTAAP